MLGSTSRFSRWGVLAALLLLAVSLSAAVATLAPLPTGEKLAHWARCWTYALDPAPKGGTSLLYRIDRTQLSKDWLQNLRTEARQALNEEKIAYKGVWVDGNLLRVALRDPAQTEAALSRLKKLAQPLSAAPPAASPQAGAGYNLTAASEADGIVTLEPALAGLQEKVKESVPGSIEVLQRRIGNCTGGTVQAEGEDRIRVRVPGKDAAAAKRLTGTTGRLTFQLADETVTPEEAQAAGVPPGDVLLPGAKDDHMYLLHKEVILSGGDLEKAFADFDARGGEPALGFEFTRKGAAAFARATTENVGKRFAIVLDNKVIFAPVIREPITGGRGQITGGFSVQDVQELALLLQSGALPAPLTVLEETAIER